ncbi:MAG: pilus assembly protein [Endomicrobia bacterium]|nr:pilus assembly protein [Endomicrobiia bacterium]
MFVVKKINNKKGQALVEAALTAPLIVFFLFTIIWFGRIMLTWQQLVSAARYGTDLIAYTPYNEEEIRADVMNYLCSDKTIGRTLSSSTVSIDELHISRFDTIDFTLFDFGDMNSFNPMEILKKAEVTAKFFKDSVVPDKSFIKISYKYRVPPILRSVSGNTLGEYFEIRVKSEILAGTGSPGENRR